MPELLIHFGNELEEGQVGDSSVEKGVFIGEDVLKICIARVECECSLQSSYSRALKKSAGRFRFIAFTYTNLQFGLSLSLLVTSFTHKVLPMPGTPDMSASSHRYIDSGKRRCQQYPAARTIESCF